jgi:hypothetical protein
MSNRLAQLEKEGWVRQFEASEPRLSEAVQLYQQSGFEVHLEPVELLSADCSNNESKRCLACFEGFQDQYKIIFTRKRRRNDNEKGLFEETV